MRPIDADKLLKDIEQYHLSDGFFQHWVEVQPTIERKKGKWIIREALWGETEAKCPCCGFETFVNEPGNGLHMVSDLHYCPNCGAEMEKDDE